MRILYCMLFSSRVRIRIRFSVWLDAHVFITLSVVVVTLHVHCSLVNSRCSKKTSSWLSDTLWCLQSYLQCL